MRYLCFFILLFMIGSSWAQESVEGMPLIQLKSNAYSVHSFNSTKIELAKITKNSKLISVRSNDAFFHRTYLINQDVETLSSGFRPAPYFRPNDNPIVIAGMNYDQRDSFNPYGADDMTSVIILSTVNSFITRIKSAKRK